MSGSSVGARLLPRRVTDHLHRAHLDAHRYGILQRAGYRVLRIPAALVTSDLEAAVALIREGLAT